MSDPQTPIWAHKHVHEPNPQPPSSEPTLQLIAPTGQITHITVEALRALPLVAVNNCYIVSTGHGRSGPFTFVGARLLDLVQQELGAATSWSTLDVISADGFGTRVQRTELQTSAERPFLLSYALNDQPLTRAQGLVRLIVPSETDDALRQVKWVAEIRVYP